MAFDPDDTAGLVGSAAAGDDAAWAALVRRFSGLVWSVARSQGVGNADAEEVFQTTWLRLAEHIGGIKEPERLGAWLATTARHEAHRVIRIRRRVTLVPEPDLLDRSEDLATPEHQMIDSEEQMEQYQRLREVWSAFLRLPARCQQLLRLLFASPPLSYTEIATLLSIPVGSIGPTRARCLQRLRLRLAGPDTPGSPLGS